MYLIFRFIISNYHKENNESLDLTTKVNIQGLCREKYTF